MNLAATEYAKHLDTTPHLQSPKKEDARTHAQAARSTGMTICYTSSFQTPVVAEELRGPDVRVGTAISFSYEYTSIGMKFAKIKEGLRLRVMAIDMAVNVRRLCEGDNEFTRREVKGLVEWTRGTALSKIIFEAYFLADEEIAKLIRICSDVDVDYVKTATESQGFPTETQVQVMRNSITNDNTKLKVSGIPRAFTTPTVLWMVEQLGVSLIDTRSATSLVQQCAAHLGTS